jgi:hypothetical protein
VRLGSEARAMASPSRLIVQVCPAPGDDTEELAELAGVVAWRVARPGLSAVDRLPDQAVPPGREGYGRRRRVAGGAAEPRGVCGWC